MIKMGKVLSQYFALGGGLDQITPPIELPPGRVLDSKNYEPIISGGYRRINGFERFDGRDSPTDEPYYILYYTSSGSVSVGQTVTGQSSGATSTVLAVVTGYLVVWNVTGTYTIGENLSNGSVFGVATSSQQLNAGTTSALNAAYALLAANAQRALIGAVPGSGNIRGVAILGDTVYAFRDNAGGTAGAIYKSTASGWSAVSLGREIQFATRTGTVTITIASPGVVTLTAHGFANGQTVVLTTTGALPTGLTAGTTYYIVNRTANTFELSATSGGASINTSGSQSGTHTATFTPSEITNGSTITGASSGATAVVTAVLLRTGTWSVAPVGTLVFASVTGTFSSGETLQVSSSGKVGATTADTAITRQPGGRVETFNYNFAATGNTQKMYGADGVNLGFEFDGTVYVPIRTGMTTDTPLHVIVHKQYLIFSFNASVQLSGIANPYSWTVLTGASEINCSYPVTGFISMTGNTDAASLAIFTSFRTFVLYGSSTSDFKLVSSTFDLGYIGYTMQSVGNNTFGMTSRGIQALTTTLNYGDFLYAAVSALITPLITAKRGMEISSTTLRNKNQYRIYYDDNTCLVVGLSGDKVTGILPLDYGMPVLVITTGTFSDGDEVTFFGSEDGYIYQDNVGTSFDGEVIEAWMRIPFANMGSPFVRKRWRRGVIELTVESYTELNISYDLGYANPDVAPAAPYPDQNINGAGGYWDSFTWDRFTWDSQFINNPSISITGTEKNLSLLFYSESAQDGPHVLSGVTLNYTAQRMER